MHWVTGQRLFEVQLTLTGDDDPELSGLTDCIHDNEIGGGTGWHRLGTRTDQDGTSEQS